MFKPPRHMKPKKTIPFRHVFVLSIILFIGLTVWGLWLINKGLEPVLMDIAETKADQIASSAINQGIRKKEIKYMEQNANVDDLIQYKENSDGDITAVTVNPVEVNRLLFETHKEIQNYLRRVEQGKIDIAKSQISDGVEVESDGEGIIYRIPLGAASNNALLSNLGPMIPVRFEVISDVVTDIGTKFKEAGINNVWLEVFIEIEVDVRIVIPFATRTTTIRSTNVIIQQLIPGEVPIYMGGDGSGGVTPTIPVKPGRDRSLQEQR